MDAVTTAVRALGAGGGCLVGGGGGVGGGFVDGYVPLISNEIVVYQWRSASGGSGGEGGGGRLEDGTDVDDVLGQGPLPTILRTALVRLSVWNPN